MLGKKTLCLGLQSVLMSVSTFAAESADEIVQVQKTGAPASELAISYRPYVYDFLEDMKTKYELVVYSSFSNEYLQAAVDALEKKQRYFFHRFCDEFCLFANIAYSVKCLDFLYANRSPADVIVVDNSPKALPLSPDNFLPINFYDGKQTLDSELPKLALVLDQLASVDDVRVALRQYRTQW